jgi:hypothetical protein
LWVRLLWSNGLLLLLLRRLLLKVGARLSCMRPARR